MPPQPTALDTTPLYRPADVADLAARHPRLSPTGPSVAGAWTEWAGRTPDGRAVSLRADSDGYGPFRARVEVGPTDQDDDWQVAVEYATPAWVLDQLLAALLGETAAVSA